MVNNPNRKKIAVIGAGFAGLSIAWHLIETGKCVVSVFDSQGVGAGASGIAAGLLHPYPGEKAKRSYLATQAIAATKRLLAIAQNHSQLPLFDASGILRHVRDEQVRQTLISHSKTFADVEMCGENIFLMRSGMTIFCKPYLEALASAAQEKGVQLHKQHIDSLEELSGYDHIILAVGAGISAFVKMQLLRIELLKGQILKCRIPPDLCLPQQSQIGKGYIARSLEKQTCYLGATYERRESNPLPDLCKAQEELFAKTALFFPQAPALIVQDCFAAFRVMRIGHYLPIIARLNRRLWAITALGSRGLLYHGLIGQSVRDAILENPH